jgi:hypothetical protein
MLFLRRVEIGVVRRDGAARRNSSVRFGPSYGYHRSMSREQLTVRSKLEREKDATWWYLHIPREVRELLKHAERGGPPSP